MIIQGYNFFFLQISFLGHKSTLEKYILSTLFTISRQDCVCVYVYVCVCVCVWVSVRNGRMLVFSIQLKFNTSLFSWCPHFGGKSEDIQHKYTLYKTKIFPSSSSLFLAQLIVHREALGMHFSAVVFWNTHVKTPYQFIYIYFLLSICSWCWQIGLLLKIHVRVSLMASITQF